MWDSFSSLVDTASKVVGTGSAIYKAVKGGFGALSKEGGGSGGSAPSTPRASDYMHSQNVKSPAPGKTLVAGTTPKPSNTAPAGNDPMDMAQRLAKLTDF